MKIAVIIDTWFPFVGGGQINAWEISKLIALNGHKVDIITRNNGHTDKLKSKNLKVIQLGDETKIGNTFAQIQFCFRSIGYVSNKKYDLVHAHAFWPGFTLLALKLIKRIPTVYTVHGTSINSNLKGIFPKIIETLLLTKIPYDYQITVSRDFLSIPNINKKIEYISNAPNISKFDDIKASKSKNPTLLFAGRLHPQKNLKNLLIAISLAKKEINNIKLIIAGDGPQKKELTQQIFNLKLKNNVDMLGEIKNDQLVKAFKSATLYILPSIYEGQSLSLLEAFAAKLSPIVTAVGDSGYLVKEAKNGFVITNPYDPEDIKEAIIKAIKSKNLEKFAEVNYKFLKENISWKVSARKTLDIYKRAS